MREALKLMRLYFCVRVLSRTCFRYSAHLLPRVGNFCAACGLANGGYPGSTGVRQSYRPRCVFASALPWATAWITCGPGHDVYDGVGVRSVSDFPFVLLGDVFIIRRLVALVFSYFLRFSQPTGSRIYGCGISW